MLIPGAGGAAWYWHRVVPLLRAAGHEAIAVSLPGDDEQAGLPEYARLVIDAIGRCDDVVLVASSLGGFTAALVAAAVPLRGLVFVNAMIPVPGETAGDWWANTGAVDARTAAAKAGGYGEEFDERIYFLHDVPADVIAVGEEHRYAEADAVFGSVCEFEHWPDVTIRVAVAADDRMFPARFQQRIARERLGLNADTLPGGHLIALSQPRLLADYVLDAAR
jgi:pimeloyl-ACP methyl ester carboxylesterase